ncbi:MAG: hypothetical protein JWM34_1297 [Ilumatobacteraceae bacterium]|nr:hypothetical protein [Ilumatobacteraceae bacterium]
MRPDPSRLTSEFLQAYISSPAGRAKLERVAQGVTMPNLNGDIVGDLEIPVPPIEEQRRIAAILDKADGLRAKRRAALAHLDALTQSIFIDMFDSGGETAALGEVVSAPLKNGTSPAAAGLVRGRVLTLSAITRGRFDESAVKDALFVKDPTIERSVRYDDFLICRGNGNPDLVGQGRYPLRGMPDTAYPDTMIAAPIPSDRMARRFMEVAWSQQSVREQIAAAARTTNGTFKVNQESLEKIRVPRPPLHEQQRFEATVFALDGMRQSSVQSGSVVDELFTSLQQRAFAGAL